MQPILRVAVAILLLMVSAASRADVTVVEYFHSGFNHHFITPVPVEIALLDAKAPPFQLWSRTGVTFRAYDSNAAPAGSVAICRFFNSSFAPKSSHFYAPKGLGCETTLANYPDWGLEDDRLFAVALPDAGGTCPGATVPVYRLYNNGLSGAPNHRFVVSLAERQKMLDKGYLAEGNGIGVGMCVTSVNVAAGTAEGFWKGTTDKGQAVRILVLDNGTYYIVYTEAGNQKDAGVLYGSATAADGQFTSTQNANYSLTGFLAPFAGGGTPLTGTYVAKTSLQLTNGLTSLSAVYDDGYDHPATLASLAGQYSVMQGHITESFGVTALINDQGQITMQGRECTFTGTLTPRGSENVFNMTIRSNGCFNGTGILYYDVANQKIYGLAQFYNGLLGFEDMYHVIGTRQ